MAEVHSVDAGISPLIGQYCRSATLRLRGAVDSRAAVRLGESSRSSGYKRAKAGRPPWAIPIIAKTISFAPHVSIFSSIA